MIVDAKADAPNHITASVRAADAAKNITLTVHTKGARTLAVRFRIAATVIRFGCWIAGINYGISSTR